MVKLDSTGLETPAIKLGEGHLSENDNGDLSWNNNTLLTNAEMGYSHFVGEQWISFDGSIPAGGIPCDGRSVERNLYPDLVKWIQDNNRAISKEEYQTMLSNSYDNVPYYVLEEDTIIMPSYRGYLYFNSNYTPGTYIKQGLPNITGTIGGVGTNNTETNYSGFEKYSGAFTKSSTSNYTGNMTGSTTPAQAAAYVLNFKASSSNAIYGASSNVTPHTTCILVGVYAFNTISNQANIDLETFRQTMESGLNTGIIPCFPSTTVEVPAYSNKLCVTKASTENAPSNGVILSIWTNANYNGQVYIGDNATRGLYYRGMSGGTQGDWKRVIHIEASYKSGKTWYRKYSDGWIEQGGEVAVRGNTKSWTTVSFPISFSDTNYTIVTSGLNADDNVNYTDTGASVKSRTKTSCQLRNWDYQGNTWYACGY